MTRRKRCEKLITIRKDLELTQITLAEILGVSKVTVAQWELGVFMPRMSLIPLLADTLGLSIEDVVLMFCGDSKNPS